MLPFACLPFLLPIFLECGYDSWHSSSHWDHEVTLKMETYAKDCEKKKKNKIKEIWVYKKSKHGIMKNSWLIQDKQRTGKEYKTGGINGKQIVKLLQ